MKPLILIPGVLGILIISVFSPIALARDTNTQRLIQSHGRISSELEDTIVYWKADFETGDLSQVQASGGRISLEGPLGNWKNYKDVVYSTDEDPFPAARVSVTDESAYSGRYAMKFEVLDEDYGRAHIDRWTGFDGVKLEKLEEWWHGWAFWLPDDFYRSSDGWVSCAGAMHEAGEPDVSRGYTKTNGCSFYGVYVDGAQRLVVRRFIGCKHKIVDGNAYLWTDSKPVELGVWHTFVIGISAKEHGWIVIYYDGKKVYENNDIDLRSSTVNPGGHLKAGYRHSEIGKSQYLLVDEIWLANTYEGAMPRRG